MQLYKYLIALLAASLITIFAPQWLQGQETKPQSSDQTKIIETLKNLVRGQEIWLAKMERMHEMGAFSDYQLDLFRYELASFRHDLALTMSNRSEARKQAMEMISIHEQQLKRTRNLYQRHAVTLGDLRQAQVNLELTKYFWARGYGERSEAIAHLENIVTSVRQEILQLHAMEESGVPTELAMHKAVRMLALTKYVSEDLRGDDVRKLHCFEVAVQTQKNIVEHYARMYQQMLTSENETFFEVAVYLELKWRLEELKGDHQEQLATLKNLEQRYDDYLKRLIQRPGELEFAHEFHIYQWNLQLVRMEISALDNAQPAPIRRDILLGMRHILTKR